MFTMAGVLFRSTVKVRIGVRIRFSVWLVNCYGHVFVQTRVHNS